MAVSENWVLETAVFENQCGGKLQSLTHVKLSKKDRLHLIPPEDAMVGCIVFVSSYQVFDE